MFLGLIALVRVAMFSEDIKKAIIFTWVNTFNKKVFKM